MALSVEIVTPENRVYQNPQVSSVVLPTANGEVGILPGHQPLLTILAPGELQVVVDGKVEQLAIDKGFAEVLGDKISVLTHAAINVATIDEKAVEEARKRAEEALKNKEGMTPEELEATESVVRFAIAQLTVKSRKR
jgi:F-type H+-transporting ATPase subunit epsilon